MVDKDYLRKLVADYKFYSRPNSGNYSDKATVGDINKVIDRTARLFEQFINALEDDD